MRSRILVAVVGVPLILLVILWAPLVVLELVLALLAGIGAWELMNCVGAHPNWKWGVSLAVLLAVLVPRISGEAAYLPLLLCYTLLLFALAVWEAGEVKLLETLAALFCVIVLPYAFASFLRLDDMGYHRGFLLLPLIFSFCSDTFAFFAGRAFGRHKLAPKVSPNKTVEGSVGGLLGNAAGGVVFALVMNTWFGGDISCAGMALLGLGCSVVAQLGDLSFSLIKREFGIKDYGHLFLAHGGVLDRFDSVLFVAPVLAVLMPVIL